MHIFLISLPDPPCRREAGLNRLLPTGMPFEIVDGVEAKNWQQRLLPGPIGWLKPGEIGCYLAHLRALRRIVDYRLPYACVLEDDFAFAADPDIGLADLDSNLPADFHYVHIQRDVGINPNFQAREQCGYFQRVSNTPMCTTGYVVTYPLAEYILAHHSEPRTPIDALYNDLAARGNFYSLCNPIIEIADGLQSVIHDEPGRDGKDNLLIDCGTHHWQGYEQLREKFDINPMGDWSVFSLEANPETHRFAAASTPLGIELIHAAASDHDGTITFHPIKDQHQGSNALTYPPRDECGDEFEYLETVEVPCVDLARFAIEDAVIRSRRQRRVLKLDIEGSEYAVLLRMMSSNVLAMFTHIVIERHSRFFQGAANELCLQIEKSFETYCCRNEIEIVEWC